ncbi:protocadherin-8-like, partial [Clarias magur]
VFRPLLAKGHFEPVSLWQGEKYTLQRSEMGSVDQRSMKDSGKGDSDSNDSDSDSGQARRNIANIGHQRASSSLYTGPMGPGMCRTKEIPTHSTSTHLGNTG